MDYNYIKEKLKYTLKIENDEEKTAYLKKLVHELDKESKTHTNISTSASSILTVVEEYNNTYLTLIDNFHSIDLDRQEEKGKIAQEILCILSAMHVYLTNTIAMYSERSIKAEDMYKYIKRLTDKKESCISDKFTWGNILKNITTSTAKKTEIIKYKMSIEK